MSELMNVRQFAAVHAASVPNPSANQLKQKTGLQPNSSQPTSAMSPSKRFSSLFSSSQNSDKHLGPYLETQLMHRPYN